MIPTIPKLLPKVLYPTTTPINMAIPQIDAINPSLANKSHKITPGTAPISPPHYT